MKIQFPKTTLPAAIALVAFSGATRAQDNSCNNGTLRGVYAFTVAGQILNANGTATTRNGVALTTFDGAGNLTQVDYVISLTPGATPPGGLDTAPIFRTNETGSYTVNADCTGSAEIDMPPRPGGAVIKLMFVLGNRAETIHTVVSSLTPPGASAPVPVLIRSDGVKLGAVPLIASVEQ